MKKNIIIYALIFVSVSLIISCSAQKAYPKRIINISSTILTVTASINEEEMDILMNEITNEINRTDFILNPYNEESEISIVNKKSKEGIKEIAISDELADIFAIGLKYSAQNPSFDISVRPLIELWGFGVKENQTVPKKEEIEKALKNIGYKNVSIKTNENGSKSLILLKPLTFDFGSYGKGYILTKLINIFKSKNIKNYLIDYGGDDYAYGVNPKGKPWIIAVRNPREGEIEGRYLTVIETTNAAIVTSGDYERYFMEDGKRYCHIIDAVTGYPSLSAVSTTIVTTNSADADAMSTMAFLMGTNFFTNESFIYKDSYMVIENEKNEYELFNITNNLN